ncbi:uncharacterized protein [Periplaneta americana]|uniref:uncharacterized protein n=1 Tax=Periplaneta americana TaxID=6978 RepID=UPI0037E7443C
MPQVRVLKVHQRTGLTYIKKGHIHSAKALLKRRQEWLEKWSSLKDVSCKAIEEILKSDDTAIIKPSANEHSYSVHPGAVRGFTTENAISAERMWSMCQDQIFYFRPEMDLSTDEEDDDDENLLPEDLGKITISVKFSEDQIKNCGFSDSPTNEEDNASVTSPDMSHQSESDDDIDSESGPSRPVSRISIELPYDDYDDLRSDYESDTLSRPSSRMSRCDYMSYYETDGEADDICSSYNLKKTKRNVPKYGHIPGVPVGKHWKLRKQCTRLSVHRPIHAGIHGGPQGAYSMVLSTDYAVDDNGKEFVYFGEGGRDPKTKKLVRDQDMSRGNLALVHNLQTGNPVRVIRGYQLNNKYSPATGYRYDGLYEVTQWFESKMDGFKVFVFKFVRSSNQPPPPWPKDPIEFPWVSTELQHHSSTSEDEDYSENEKRPRHRKKHHLGTGSGIGRSASDVCASNVNGAPPELELPELNHERTTICSIPPVLSPCFPIDPKIIDLSRKPVVVLERLDMAEVPKLLSSFVEQAPKRTTFLLRPQQQQPKRKKKKKVIEAKDSQPASEGTVENKKYKSKKTLSAEEKNKKFKKKRGGKNKGNKVANNSVSYVATSTPVSRDRPVKTNAKRNSEIITVPLPVKKKRGGQRKTQTSSKKRQSSGARTAVIARKNRGVPAKKPESAISTSHKSLRSERAVKRSSITKKAEPETNTVLKRKRGRPKGSKNKRTW